MLQAALRRPTGIAIILILALIAIVVLGYSRPVFSATVEDGPALEVSLIKQFEGFSHTPYPDAGGYSIGYGHQILDSEDIDYVTVAQGERLLAKDVRRFADAVDDAVTVKLNPRQRAALISLCYNIGEGNFGKSALLRKLNKGDYAGATKEFAKWNKSKGKVVKALTKRRAIEAKMFAS